MKHLKTTSETLEIWRRRQPRPTLWRTAVASKRRLGAVEREDGSRQEAGRSEERHAGSSCRGPRRVGLENSAASGVWRWGDRQAAVLGRGVARRCVAGTVEHAAVLRARWSTMC
jgi:hypothetical protein